MFKDLAIVWFRQDLRLTDNPALNLAANHKAVLPIYIVDECSSKLRPLGAASNCWLHHSLFKLNESLDNKLSLYKGSPVDIIIDLISKYSITAVYWNRCYDPGSIARDQLIKHKLLTLGVEVESKNGSLLWEPWEIVKADGSPYQVFTPFYKKGCLLAAEPRRPLSKLELNLYKDSSSLNLNQLHLLPKLSWGAKIMSDWQVGELAAMQQLHDFIDVGLRHYKDGRNFPAKPYVSKLSPYLRFGEISPNQVWHTVRSVGSDQHIEHFCSELGWREFSYSQLYYNPDLPEVSLQKKFDIFPWESNLGLLKAWQQGLTGVPLVDAGMRQLWQTGYIHNRVRMVVGSFLVKNLLLDWRLGEKWFWDTLVDADLANNSASWQWVAGCGADAAPYFRVFNPILQGQKFDVNGEYLKNFVPELSKLPNKYIFSPWEAPAEILVDANIKLGVDYPLPIVDIKSSRKRALDAYQKIK